MFRCPLPVQPPLCRWWSWWLGWWSWWCWSICKMLKLSGDAPPNAASSRFNNRCGLVRRLRGLPGIANYCRSSELFEIHILLANFESRIQALPSQFRLSVCVCAPWHFSISFFILRLLFPSPNTFLLFLFRIFSNKYINYTPLISKCSTN